MKKRSAGMNKTAAEALNNLAEQFEKLAATLDGQTKIAKQIKEASDDYGRLGSPTYQESDALTAFLMR